jgi:hypothetical protein
MGHDPWGKSRNTYADLWLYLLKKYVSRIVGISKIQSMDEDDILKEALPRA